MEEGLKIHGGYLDARIFGWNSLGSCGPWDPLDGMEARSRTSGTIYWIGQSREKVYP